MFCNCAKSHPRLRKTACRLFCEFFSSAFRTKFSNIFVKKLFSIHTGFSEIRKPSCDDLMRLHLDRMWIKHTTQRPREHNNSAPGVQKRTLLEHIDSRLADLLNIAFCVSGVASVLHNTWRCFQTQANSSTEAISQTGATRAHVLRLFLATRLLNLHVMPSSRTVQ